METGNGIFSNAPNPEWDEEVLDAADFITESNDMDGVARYIEENLLS